MSSLNSFDGSAGPEDAYPTKLHMYASHCICHHWDFFFDMLPTRLRLWFSLQFMDTPSVASQHSIAKEALSPDFFTTCEESWNYCCNVEIDPMIHFPLPDGDFTTIGYGNSGVEYECHPCFDVSVLPFFA